MGASKQVGFRRPERLPGRSPEESNPSAGSGFDRERAVCSSRLRVERSKGGEHPWFHTCPYRKRQVKMNASPFDSLSQARARSGDKRGLALPLTVSFGHSRSLLFPERWPTRPTGRREEVLNSRAVRSDGSSPRGGKNCGHSSLTSASRLGTDTEDVPGHREPLFVRDLSAAAS